MKIIIKDVDKESQLIEYLRLLLNNNQMDNPLFDRCLSALILEVLKTREKKTSHYVTMCKTAIVNYSNMNTNSITLINPISLYLEDSKTIKCRTVEGYERLTGLEKKSYEIKSGILSDLVIRICKQDC